MTQTMRTRSPAKHAALTAAGADHVLVDDGQVARQVGRILPDGADAALELVGTPTLPDTLSARLRGVVHFTGMLSSQWTVRDFYPIDYLPRGVRLTAYSGGAADLPPQLLQGLLDRSNPAPRSCLSATSTGSMRSSRRTGTWKTAAWPESSWSPRDRP